MNSYDDACRRAAEDQHLGAFYDAPGWTVEQTGGFTMVAVRYMGDGHCYTVTYDGDGYMGCRQTVKGWQEGAEPDDVPGDALGTTYGLPLAFEEVAHVVAGWEAQR
jgi:hypothetical protein